jgi:hypothetical protein
MKTMTGGKRRKTCHRLVELVDRPPLRQRHGQQGQPRSRTHCGEIAQVDRQGPMANRVWWHERPIEMHAFDETIDTQNLDPIPRRLHHRRIVTNPYEHPVGRGGKVRANALDERTLSQFAYGDAITLILRNPPPWFL